MQRKDLEQSEQADEVNVSVVISQRVITAKERIKIKAGKNQKESIDNLFKEQFKSRSESKSKESKTPALSQSEDFQSGKAKVKHSDSYQSHSKTIRHTPSSSERQQLKHFDLNQAFKSKNVTQEYSSESKPQTLQAQLTNKTQHDFSNNQQHQFRLSAHQSMAPGVQHLHSPNAFAVETMRSSFVPTNQALLASGTRPDFSSRKNSVYFSTTSPYPKAQESPLYNRNLDERFAERHQHLYASADQRMTPGGEIGNVPNCVRTSPYPIHFQSKVFPEDRSPLKQGLNIRDTPQKLQAAALMAQRGGDQERPFMSRRDRIDSCDQIYISQQKKRNNENQFYQQQQISAEGEESRSMAARALFQKKQTFFSTLDQPYDISMNPENLQQSYIPTSFASVVHPSSGTKETRSLISQEQHKLQGSKKESESQVVTASSSKVKSNIKQVEVNAARFLSPIDRCNKGMNAATPTKYSTVMDCLRASNRGTLTSAKKSRVRAKNFGTPQEQQISLHSSAPSGEKDEGLPSDETPCCGSSKKQQRKERGLRFLSRDVKRIVAEKKASSYKEVAAILIEEMRQSNKMDDYDNANDDLSDSSGESPAKKSKLSSCMSKEKKEKNVKRRVYDALNVLKAANVLIENQKLVTCSNFYETTFDNPVEMMSDPECSYESDNTDELGIHSTQKIVTRQQLEESEHELAQMRQKIVEKRHMLKDLTYQGIGYRRLLKRNEKLERKQTQKYMSRRKSNVQRQLQGKPEIEYKDEPDQDKRIQLPFIMAAVKETPTNTMYLEKQPKSLRMSSFEKIRYFGDGDVLQLMKFGQVPCTMFEEFIGPEGKEIRNLLHQSKQKLQEDSPDAQS